MAQPPGGFAPRKEAPPAKAGTPYDVDALKRVTGRFLTEAPLGVAKGMVEPLFGMPTTGWGKGTRAALAGVRSVLPGGGSYEDERQRIAASDEARYPGVGSVIPEVSQQAVQRGTAQDALIGGSSMAPAVIAFHGGPAGILPDPYFLGDRHTKMMGGKPYFAKHAAETGDFNRGALFSSTNPEVAETYARAATGEYGHLPASIQVLDVNPSNPLVVEGGGKHWSEVVPGALKSAAEGGRDGAFLHNISDSAFKSKASLPGSTLVNFDFKGATRLGEFRSAKDFYASDLYRRLKARMDAEEALRRSGQATPEAYEAIRRQFSGE